MTTTSRLIEELGSELINDDGTITVTVIDRSGLATEVTVDNPFAFDSSRFAPNSELMDLDRFVEVTRELLVDAQAREGTIEAERVELVEEYPSEDFYRYGEEVIAWRLLRRQPANMSSDGTSRPQRSYRHSHSLELPQHPNKKLIVETRPIDHVLEFQCWSRSARIANRRALWLERLLVNHSWVYLSQGVDRFYWKERSLDTFVMVQGQRLFLRSLQFFVRLHDFRVRAEPLISHMTLELHQSS